MTTRKEIADLLRSRFSDVAERGRVLGQALKVRADIAVTRRRLRSALADLGDQVYDRLLSGDAGVLGEDPFFGSFQERITGLKAELKVRESELHQVTHAKKGRGADPDLGGQAEGAQGK